MDLYLYSAFLVLMTTQSALQYTLTFTQSHTDFLGRLPTFRLEDDHSTPSATAVCTYTAKKN